MKKEIENYIYKMDKYYYNQCEKQSLHCDGWLTSFKLDIFDKRQPFNNDKFIKAMLKIKPYVIARILIYDSEGYTKAIEKIKSNIK